MQSMADVISVEVPLKDSHLNYNDTALAVIALQLLFSGMGGNGGREACLQDPTQKEEH